jgi:hypothetical protein
VKKLVVLAVLLATAVPASAAAPRILAYQDAWPTWSPDGKHIAFTRIHAAGNLMELEVLDLQTRRVATLARTNMRPLPVWADNTHVGYQNGGWSYLVSLGGERRRVARGYAPACFGPLVRVVSGELVIGDEVWEERVIGRPACSSSPVGQVAFRRDDGVFITVEPNVARAVARVANPGDPVWSRDAKQLAFTVGDELWVVPADGSSPPKVIERGKPGIDTPSWSFDSKRIAFSWARGVWVSYVQGGGYAEDAHERVVGTGAAFAPTSYFVAYAASRPACPGHVAIHRRGVAGSSPVLTGSCLVTGTARADVIEGTTLWGDAIQGLAGNDQIHANDGHTDTVSCGPGRDTVWADRTDRLTGCEIVHR